MSPEIQEISRDLKMLRSPDLWPQWPVLPLKRHRPAPPAAPWPSPNLDSSAVSQG
jgi:hypothetical protein